MKKAVIIVLILAGILLVLGIAAFYNITSSVNRRLSMPFLDEFAPRDTRITSVENEEAFVKRQELFNVKEMRKRHCSFVTVHGAKLRIYDKSVQRIKTET